MWLLDEHLEFPPASAANADGVVAIGGDLAPERLLLAYRSGIFPWPVQGYPLLWFSPNPRAALEVSKAHVSRSLKKFMQRCDWRVSFDEAFDEVIQACAKATRKHESGTWITQDLIDAYRELHRLGHAHSVEVWDGTELVGGLYGVAVGRAFAGESMFHRKSNASKVAMVALLERLRERGILLIDCQMQTPLLKSFGAKLWPRDQFLKVWRALCASETNYF
jgi:leucyl/phenylalanyl-tRNA--protein transferase